MGSSGFSPVPTALYGAVLLLAAIAFYLLVRALIAVAGQTSTLANAIGSDRKGKVSPVLFALAIPLAMVAPALAFALYTAVVLIWVVPDRRIERSLAS
jgi:uncharacterized membrane protein